MEANPPAYWHLWKTTVENFPELSPECKDLIQRMLKCDP